MEKENFSIMKKSITMGNGRKARGMGMGHLWISMEICSRGSGRIT